MIVGLSVVVFWFGLAVGALSINYIKDDRPMVRMWFRIACMEAMLVVLAAWVVATS